MLDRARRPGMPAALVLALAALPAACGTGDDPIGRHDEAPAFMELTIGAQTVRFDEGGTPIAGGDPAIPLGTVPVTARFLADDGDVLDLDPDEYELRATSASPTLVTWTSTGPFSGTLTGLADGAAIVQFELFHRDEEHPDWGPHNIAITVGTP